MPKIYLAVETDIQLAGAEYDELMDKVIDIIYDAPDCTIHPLVIGGEKVIYFDVLPVTPDTWGEDEEQDFRLEDTEIDLDKIRNLPHVTVVR